MWRLLDIQVMGLSSTSFSLAPATARDWPVAASATQSSMPESTSRANAIFLPSWDHSGLWTEAPGGKAIGRRGRAVERLDAQAGEMNQSLLAPGSRVDSQAGESQNRLSDDLDRGIWLDLDL